MALLILLVHGAILLLVGKLMRIPLILIVTASMANIGGVVSAPIVAQAFDKRQVHLGILMAIFSGSLGVPLGIVFAKVVSMLS